MFQRVSSDTRLWNYNIPGMLLIILLTVALTLLAIMGVKRFVPGSHNTRAAVSAHKLRINDSLFFKDSTESAKDYCWNFGDNTQSFSANGYHKYNAPGDYIIRLTINGKYTDTFLVTVAEPLFSIPLQDSIAFIEGPLEGMQFENLVFCAKGMETSQYRWKFDETKFIDSKEPFVQYAYPQPGNYNIFLYTNNREYPVRHKIKILPSFKSDIDTL